MPYSLKQLTQECEAGINLRFITEDEPEITPVNIDKSKLLPQISKKKRKKGRKRFNH